MPIRGKRLPQQPSVRLGEEDAGGGELVLAGPAHGRLEVDQAGQPPRTGLGEQVLAHDLGVQQDGLFIQQRDAVQEAGDLVGPFRRQAEVTLGLRACRALAGHELRPRHARIPAGNGRRRNPVQRG
ncbi:MAG TPA: hypothetical protein VGD91_16230, partial [Trebonia sp.]